MAKKYELLGAFIILLFVLQQATFADEQTFSISGSLSLHNEDPCIAMNTRTGDILAVWCRFDENNRSNSKIYATLCKFKGGLFKVGKARLISGKNDTASDPYVAYSPVSNSFFVVWRIDTTISNSLFIDTQGRAVSAKGRAIGKIVKLLSTKGHFEYRAVLAAVPQSVRKGSYKAVYLMSWQLVPQVSGELETDAGLWTVFLDANGKQVSEPKRVMNMDYTLDPYNLGETWPNRIITTDKVPFYLSVVNVRLSGDNRVQEAYLVKLDDKGGYDGKVLLDMGKSPMDIRMVLLSKKRLLASWFNFNETISYNQLLKPTLKKIKSSYLTVSGNSSTSDLVGLESGGAFQVITSFPGFYTTRFDSKGKIHGSPVYHDFIYYLPGDFMAVQILGQDKVLMVWRLQKGGNSAEIKGTIFELN